MGDTALHHLLRHNQERLTAEQLAGFTDILLQYGAKMNTVGTDDETPLMLTQRMVEKDVYDVMCTAMGKQSLLFITMFCYWRVRYILYLVWK